MQVDGRAMRPIGALAAGDGIEIIDQRALPHELKLVELRTPEAVFTAIRDMWLRGAPLIGAAAAYGLALALRADASDSALDAAAARLREARPTAVNLAWAIDRVHRCVRPLAASLRADVAWHEADAIAEEDVATNAAIGRHGLALLHELARRHPDRPVRVLTHCNAGWLATVDWGTATSPIYQAHAQGMRLHVWVDETRPRNQGASLTAWELGRAGVPHAVVADNAGGHLMQQRQVDLVIVGCDRVAANGDVCNKIGTYLKALAAQDNGVPFYVAMPSSTFDATLPSGDAIPIEERTAREVTHLAGRDSRGRVVEVQLTPDGSGAVNPAFDVTPARLVTGLITEHGIVAAEAAELRRLGEHAA
ncbi:MAG: S-methyl-5-thioribose-1-phosphate isomerase [Aquincola sp.]|nr:S-methyl-5-thioribose-1-phosphate isomerase [Aquincola sp.]MDH4288009.1 S-methyl-5-thioribose-1-phosphate isomerase [Aquincola sp.]MDH5328413.1 S-methyl-5-thioribose-1-phosphate isomerase [Aquincola sp.]